jgi:hypothetical protein
MVRHAHHERVVRRFMNQYTSFWFFNRQSSIINGIGGDQIKSLLTKLEVVFIIALAIFSHSESWGFNWKYYGTNEEGSYFYEIESMKRLPGNNVRVCVQSIYTEKGLSHWVKEGGKEFQNLDFSLILSELNCAERSIRHLRILFYSKDQKIFYPAKNDEWQLFVPDSMSGALFREICK